MYAYTAFRSPYIRIKYFEILQQIQELKHPCVHVKINNQPSSSEGGWLQPP